MASSDPSVLPVLEESVALGQAWFRTWPRPDLSTLPLGVFLAEASAPLRRESALALLERFDHGYEHGNRLRQELIESALSLLTREPLSWPQDEAQRAIDAVTRTFDRHWDPLPMQRFIVEVVERAETPPETAAVERLIEHIRAGFTRAETIRLVARLRPFTAVLPGAIDMRIIDDRDPWGQTIRTVLARLEPSSGIDALLAHLGRAAASPTKRWLDGCRSLILGAPAAPELLRAMVREALDPTAAGAPEQSGRAVFWAGTNNDLVRGACLALAVTDPNSTPWLEDVAVYAGTTSGPWALFRDQKVSTGAIVGLGMIGSDPAVAALLRCRQRIRNTTLRRQIDKALGAATNGAGLDIDGLIEQRVPTHGLGADGVWATVVGDTDVEVRVDGDVARVFVRKKRGGWTTTVPRPLRDQFPDEFAELRALATTASKTLVAERARLEGLLTVERSWPAQDWKRFYRDHPLTGHLARRLLWIVGEPDAARVARVDGDDLIAIDDTAVPVGDETSVRIWHPLGARAELVLAWREKLDALTISQPFKQAWREIYLLTPAEKMSNTYSNRFAAHILGFRQAFALMKTRGWSPSSLGHRNGGSEGIATRTFPGGTWRALFHYELIQEDPTTIEPEDLCSTDQVRFEQLSAGTTWRTAPLDTVPPLIFSEALRDIDLFVGVTSIAADPTWFDRDHDRHRMYWYRTSFGDLTQSAETRRDALAQLLPRTRIADRAHIEGRFLHVTGQKRTYKIHIGSGNVLMGPNDSYLCIVPAQGSGERILLPFDDDGGRLAVILSKAFLLAADDQIDDPNIVHQIESPR